MTRLCIALLWAAATQPPRAGCSLSPSGELRTVWGVGSNFVSGAVERTGVRAAACSDNLAIAADGQEFLVFSGNVTIARRLIAGERALLNSTRHTAGAWEPGWLHLWAHSRWTTLPVPGNWLAFAIGVADVTAVSEDNGRVSVLRLDRENGGLLSAEPLEEAATAAFLWPDGALLLRTAEQVVFRSGAGVTVLPFRAEAFAAMSDDWVEARSAGGNHAIRRKGGLVEWFALP